MTEDANEEAARPGLHALPSFSTSTTRVFLITLRSAHVHPKRFGAVHHVPDWRARVLAITEHYVVVDKPPGVQVCEAHILHLLEAGSCIQNLINAFSFDLMSIANSLTHITTQVPPTVGNIQESLLACVEKVNTVDVALESYTNIALQHLHRKVGGLIDEHI